MEVKTSDLVKSKLKELELDSYKWRIFLALQRNMQIYTGTVMAKEKKRRRAANKRQRAARRAGR